MNRNLGIKAAVIAGILLVFLYGIFGIPRDLSGKGLLAAMQQRIHLGLDLRGGTHLILQVVVDDAVNAETEQSLQRLKEELKTRNVTFADANRPPDTTDKIVLSGVNPNSTTEARDVISEKLAEFDYSSGENNSFTLTLKPSVTRDIKEHAVQQAIETIRARVDTLGVSEPVIQEHGLGDYQILVQLPGVDDPARVKEIIQSTAMLEIRQAFGQGFATEQEAISYATQQPGGLSDKVVLHGTSIGGRAGDQDAYYVVTRSSVVSGRDLRDANQQRDEAGRPSVRFILNSEGAKRFASFTGANIGNSLAVVLDNKVREVATIRDQIHEEGTITGSFTEQQAKDLSMLLRSGALPASIRYLEDRTVGASLGADSIKQGVTAGIIGMALVVIFMLVYYKGAGINANIALLLNLVILLGFLGFSGATLTLPGIAGVILTIGMGVDSNVLIFERIREELRHGKTSAQAVDQGFGRAWLTILDTHVTTIVSALILFVFGSGPVRGFAVTLAFGLFANLFTAVFVSRVIFDTLLERRERGAALSI
jgi:preprotein translocase subunit SecD